MSKLGLWGSWEWIEGEVGKGMKKMYSSIKTIPPEKNYIDSKNHPSDQPQLYLHPVEKMKNNFFYDSLQINA